MPSSTITAISTPEQHYALAVNRISDAGINAIDDFSERWVNISDIVAEGGGSSLVFTDAADTNSTRLTGYRQSGSVRSIVESRFDNNQLFLRFGVFEPSFDPQTSTLRWDDSIDTITADANNPPGVDQFISSVASISLDSGNAQTLTDFTAGAFDNTPAAGQDWQQPFTLTTGNIFDSNTGATGGITIATFGYNGKELVLDLKVYIQVHLIHLLIL